jgi:hypothetical protein
MCPARRQTTDAIDAAHMPPLMLAAMFRSDKTYTTSAGNPAIADAHLCMD